MKAIWFPSRQVTERLNIFQDQELQDCGAQADLFGGNRHYVQLSAGLFSGRLLAVDVGDLRILIEYSNHRLEKEVKLEGDCFSFVTAVALKPPDIAFGGVTRSTDWVQVCPPEAERVALTPSNTLFIYARLKTTALLEHEALLPEVSDWLCDLRKNPVFVTSASLANRLRSNTLASLECLASDAGHDYRAAVKQAFIFGLVTGLNFEWLRQNMIGTPGSTTSRDRFLAARKLLLGKHEDVAKKFKAASKNLGSQRVIEQAFSNQVNMGPLSYARVVRLHNARQKLLDASLENESIGDIAAEEGFWDWSRFTTYYRRQFGELPSETRARFG
ncbi:helix-turn-helix domain-containing protein [Roseibium sp. MMSF_3544]|uniref:helix-turn-helix domain-containing protein n=1 Tax=unclassified Roseibium TaxID=2629323 RepID=UPI00273F2DF5|nr:helix-turn-helix domain-containing protein [Roseibium sp. MMSF_3544]